MVAVVGAVASGKSILPARARRPGPAARRRLHLRRPPDRRVGLALDPRADWRCAPGVAAVLGDDSKRTSHSAAPSTPSVYVRASKRRRWAMTFRAWSTAPLPGWVAGARWCPVARSSVSPSRAPSPADRRSLADDCTSSLDAHNEDRLWHDIRRACPGVIIFCVSHRPATIRRADVIVVLDGGRLVDSGTHAELSQRCQQYGELLMAEQRREQIVRDAPRGS